jgi:hypothetical protein
MPKINSFWWGMFLGILFPAIVFGILFAITKFTGFSAQFPAALTQFKQMFVSVALNIIPLRFFFVKEGFDKTARGMLLVTVILIIVITVVF